MNEKRMIKLSEFAKQCDLSYPHLHRLFKIGKLNAKQINGAGSSILIDSKNPFELTEQGETTFLDLDEIEFNGNSGPESNLELIVSVNKQMLKQELESKNPDKVAVNRYLKQLLDASKLLLQHEIDDNDIERIN